MSENNFNRTYTVKQAAKRLGVSELTVRNRIKKGQVKATKVSGRYGEQYLVEVPETEAPVHDLDVKSLVKEIAELREQVGMWKGHYEELQIQMKLLTAPAPRPWYKRLFKLS